MSSGPIVLWLRRDLRVADQPALRAAAEAGRGVVPVYVHAPDEEAPWAPGAASRWWLRRSLESLDASLRKRGSRLVIRRGPTLDALGELVAETGASMVIRNRRVEPAVAARGAAIEAALQRAGLKTRSFNAGMLAEPGEIANKQGKPYRVFTSFWKTCLRRGPPARPLPAPTRLPAVPEAIASAPVAGLGLEPTAAWAGGLEAAWTPGEAGARAHLQTFAGEPARAYDDARNRPDHPGTSRLSPHLHFGEVGPRQVWHAVVDAIGEQAAQPYTRQLWWREFAAHLLHHFPHTPEAPLNARFARFPWREDPDALSAWQQGRTGYPIVDAGMRELWATGWMHNRVRMIVASFLTKDLRLPWQEGARWFWDTLVDADLANNTQGWQWTAGCGADASPFFRVFNPVTQGERHDPRGAYVRRWVPELARLPDRFLQRPWEAPDDVLADAGVALGRDYPEPIVDHGLARIAALEAYEVVKAAR